MNCHAIDLVMAEDDPEDQMLVKEAFEEAQVINTLHIVEDGEALFDYLRACDPHTGEDLPDLILLDLNMPKKDGRECIEELKQDAQFRRIPIVVLTTSDAEEDILHSYENGASSYIRKPVTFEKLVEVARMLGGYWLGIVELPPHD